MRFFIQIPIIIFTWLALVASGSAQEQILGTWLIKMKTPMGVQESPMIIETKKDKQAGLIKTKMGDIELTQFSFEGDNLSFSGALMTAMGPMKMEFDGSSDGKTMNGNMTMPMANEPFSAKRASKEELGLVKKDSIADDIDALYARGSELFNLPYSCTLCHGAEGQGGAGPNIQYGPTPDLIDYQLRNNPQMGPLSTQLKLSHDDLLAISVYIKTLTGTQLAKVDLAHLQDALTNIREQSSDLGVEMTERDKAISKYETFQSVLDDWTRKAKTGNIKRTYKTQTVATFEPGEQKFFPEAGKVYFYENTGLSASMFGPREPGRVPAKTSKVVVGDAESKEVITWGDIPPQLRGDNHFTSLSPDARYAFITGGKALNPDGTGGSAGEEGMPMPEGGHPFATAMSSILKVDSKTLQPIQQFTIGARAHHMQVFRDKYMLIDSFSRDPDGLNVMLLDPETNEIIGGVRDQELGGISYTSFTDDKFIYVLMQPSGYPGGSISGYIAGVAMGVGKYIALRPFWVAKINPDTWEVVGEFPYPGYRGNWVIIDDDENIYVPAGASSNVTKIDTKTGEVLWTQSTGIGPYGGSLNADGSELWVADKGETTNFFGRTITVFDTKTGTQLETLPSAYQVDHVILAPNGKEFWASSNAEGRLYIFDAATRQLIKKLDMPSRGDAHGMVWVTFDEDGNGKLLRDQGNFHNGINPRKGITVDYPVQPEQGFFAKLFGSD